jgi:hypothetical protein
MKPNFFIIGAPKCGTTALSKYLKEHPNIYFCKIKEPHFFDKDFSPKTKISEEVYLSLFADADLQKHKAIGEGSTGYLISSCAVNEILKFNPNSKFIIMLRNPIELARAWHSQKLFEGVEDIKDFEQAWRAQEARSEGKNIPMACQEVKSLLYAQWAKLGDQVERFLSIVPRDRAKIILFDEFVSDARRVYEEILLFLDVPPDNREKFEKFNENKKVRLEWAQQLLTYLAGVVRKTRSKVGYKMGLNLGLYSRLLTWNSAPAPKSVISDDFKSELRNYFKSDVEKLSKLVERDLIYWFSDQAN